MLVCEKFDLRGLLFLLVLLTTIASRVESIRDIKEKNYQSYLLQNQLPRGPAPPSGPSPCHNKLDPFNQNKFSFHLDYVMCP